MRRRVFALLGASAALSRPSAASAQQPVRIYRIGILSLLADENTSSMKWLVERLHALGYVQGRNVIVDLRSASGQPERLQSLAVELVALRPDVLVAGFGTLAAKAVKAATSAIPAVFVTVGDPVGAGVVESLGRPGSNVTGLTDQAKDISGKRLALLQDAVGGKTSFAVLMNPDTPFSALALKEIQEAADARRVQITALEARTANDVTRRMAEVGAGIGGLLVLGDTLTLALRGPIADFALKKRLPTASQSREFVEAGGLLSYGPDRRQFYVRAAEYVDRILKGANPADLPVEQPTRFELVINARTAKAIGLALPAAMLAGADEVIE